VTGWGDGRAERIDSVKNNRNKDTVVSYVVNAVLSIQATAGTASNMITHSAQIVVMVRN
jgi:hypothetical protein